MFSIIDVFPVFFSLLFDDDAENTRQTKKISFVLSSICRATCMSEQLFQVLIFTWHIIDEKKKEPRPRENQ